MFIFTRQRDETIVVLKSAETTMIDFYGEKVSPGTIHRWVKRIASL